MKNHIATLVISVGLLAGCGTPTAPTAIAPTPLRLTTSLNRSVELVGFTSGQKLESGLIYGTVDSSWAFEGDFPVSIVNEQGDRRYGWAIADAEVQNPETGERIIGEVGFSVDIQLPEDFAAVNEGQSLFLKFEASPGRDGDPIDFVLVPITL